MERIDTHEDDPERRKDEGDIIGKMLNMIGSLRQELGNLWNRNAVLEKELAELKPKDAVCSCPSVQDPQPLLCGDESNRQETLQPSADEGDGGKAVQGVDDVCSKVACVHCDAEAEEDKKCCDKPACDECDAFGKFARGEKQD